MVVARGGRWISYAFHRRRAGMVREMHQRCPKRVSNPCRRRFFRPCHQPSAAAEPSVTGRRSLPANRGEGIASPLELRDQAPSACVHANSTAPEGLIYRRSTVATSATRRPPALPPFRRATPGLAQWHKVPIAEVSDDQPSGWPWNLQHDTLIQFDTIR